MWVEQIPLGPVICTFSCCPPSTQPRPLPPGERHQLTPMMVPLSTPTCTGSGRRAQGMSDQNTPSGDLQPSCSAGLGLLSTCQSFPCPAQALWVLLAHVATLTPRPPKDGQLLLPPSSPGALEEGACLTDSH